MYEGARLKRGKGRGCDAEPTKASDGRRFDADEIKAWVEANPLLMAEQVSPDEVKKANKKRANALAEQQQKQEAKRTKQAKRRQADQTRQANQRQQSNQAERGKHSRRNQRRRRNGQSHRQRGKMWDDEVVKAADKAIKQCIHKRKYWCA